MALGARFSGLIRDGGVVSRDGFPRVEEGLDGGGGGEDGRGGGLCLCVSGVVEGLKGSLTTYD